ncbi:MAG: ABC transporter substrate-binding protein [Desulfobacteraceae bacterium]|nr:ABC transporter substrate-binding protein [Desulfobacteraceae bacterium]
MRRCVVAAILVLSAMFIITGILPAQAADKLIKFPAGCQPEFETFFTWYAKDKGWDKEAGLDIEMKYFDSGMGMMEALPAKQWAVGGTSGTPATVGAARYGTKIITLADDEGLANVVMVRPDSPILKVKGHNPKCPEIYGSPETVKGKTVIATTVSSSHFVLNAWLKALGLNDSDVVIKNMDQFQAVAAFEAGIGDIVSLWAPHMYTGLEKGWKVVGNIRHSGSALPLVLVGEPEFLEKNPETVAKFLQVFFRGIDMVKSTPVEKLVPDYKRFMQDYCGLEMSDAMCKLDIESHPVFSIDEQLKMFDNSNGPSVIEKWQMGVLDFFTSQGKLKKEDVAKVVDAKGVPNFVTDKYLKMAKKK